MPEPNEWFPVPERKFRCVEDVTYLIISPIVQFWPFWQLTSNTRFCLLFCSVIVEYYHHSVIEINLKEIREKRL